LEEHLLGMFRDDFEFNDQAAPSHLGHGHSNAAPMTAAAANPEDDAQLVWLADAESELRKIPFFVRGKARRNTETYAVEHGISAISVDTLYEAKAHFGR
ncbi:MAG: ferredoxin:protochlorophyllide reductase (ATP-dependent) subunit B, partial [Pseudomonadota bacterium]